LPNPAFLRNRQRANGFSREERPLAVVEVPTDRFMRKIVGFLTLSCAARSRQLNAILFGRFFSVTPVTYAHPF